ARGNGSYSLKPVIRVIPTALNGIIGFVDSTLLASNVTVSAQVNGFVVRSTVPTQTGEFLVARLTPGNYDLVITADGHVTAVIGSVPITSTTTILMVSTNAAPIALPSSATKNISGTVSLNPADSTVPAFVVAKQTFGSTPTVTVKTQSANLISGAYLLTLP